eukprot:4494663-Karenia_brevis.AAC.1
MEQLTLQLLVMLTLLIDSSRVAAVLLATSRAVVAMELGSVACKLIHVMCKCFLVTFATGTNMV